MPSNIIGQVKLAIRYDEKLHQLLAFVGDQCILAVPADEDRVVASTRLVDGVSEALKQSLVKIIERWAVKF